MRKSSRLLPKTTLSILQEGRGGKKSSLRTQPPNYFIPDNYFFPNLNRWVECNFRREQSTEKSFNKVQLASKRQNNFKQHHGAFSQWTYFPSLLNSKGPCYNHPSSERPGWGGEEEIRSTKHHIFPWVEIYVVFNSERCKNIHQNVILKWHVLRNWGEAAKTRHINPGLDFDTLWWNLFVQENKEKYLNIMFFHSLSPPCDFKPSSWHYGNITISTFILKNMQT